MRHQLPWPRGRLVLLLTIGLMSWILWRPAAAVAVGSGPASPPALPRVQDATVSAPLPHIPGGADALGTPPHACQDPWEALNPLANCYVDPTRPLRDALGTAITSALTAWVVSVCDDLAAALGTVFDWAGLTEPADPRSPQGLLASTPAAFSYAHPVVLRYWAVARLAADGALALLFLLTGFEIMMSTRVGRSYEGALDALRHILLAALLANVSLDLLRLIIEVSNGLCAAVGGAVALPAGLTTGGGDETVAHALFRLLYLVVATLVLVQLLVRLALLDLLIILSPLGLLCYASPRAARWAQLWTHLFVATALQQFLQLVALHVSSDLLTQLPAAGSGTTVGILLGCASLLLVFRLPLLLRGMTMLGTLPTVAGMASALGEDGERRATARDAQAEKWARTQRTAGAGGGP